MSRQLRRHAAGEANAHAGRADRTPPDLTGSAPSPKARLRTEILSEVARLVRLAGPLASRDFAHLHELVEHRRKLEKPRQGTLPLDRAEWRKGADDGNPFA